MDANKTGKVVRGALLLTIAGLLSKVLSATYRIPLQNLTGDLGFFTYQQVYPFIGMTMILGLYGFPVAVSKLVAERNALGKVNSVRLVYGPIFIILFVFSAIFAFLLFVFAEHITIWMETPQLVGAFQLASLLFIMLPFIAVLRGGFQGQEEMAPTAYSQMIEQLIRVTIIIVVAYFVFIGKIEILTIGKAGVIASLIGTGLVTFVWIVYTVHKRGNHPHFSKEKIPWVYYIKVCFSMGIVAALSHMILILLQLVDVFTIVPGLMKDNIRQVQAMEWKGIFDRGQALIQFGVVFGSSFALALVPAVVQHKKARIMAIREAALFSMYLSVPASIGLIMLMPEVNKLLYLNTLGTSSLQILAISIFLSAIGITVCSILQNMGDVWLVAGWIMVAFAMKWVLNIILVPLLHINGSALATVLSLLFIVVAVLSQLQRRIPGLQLFRHIRWGAFLVANMAMVIFLMFLKYTVAVHIEFSRSGLGIYVFIVILMGAAIYMMVLLRYKVLSEKQLQALPFSNSMQAMGKRLEKNKKDEKDA